MQRPIVGSLACALLLAAGNASAEIFVVNDAGEGVDPDEAVTTLREAVLAANANPPGERDVILFAASLDGEQPVTIQLASELPVTGDVTISTQNSPPAVSDPDVVIPAIGVADLTIRGPGGGTLFDIASGDLELVDLTLANGEVTISSGANLVYTPSEEREIAFSDPIVDAGGVEKDGAGTLTLLGQNSYAGGTRVRAGTLVGNASSIPSAGGVLISGGARLVLDVDGVPETFSGLIEGSGAFEKSGPGTLVLSRSGGATANSWSGGTQIAAGTLQGDTQSLSGAGAVTNDGILVFDQGLDGTFEGTISGAGSLVKQGTGNLTLAPEQGANSYRGITQIDAGVLTGSTAAIPGNVTIAGGALLEFAQDLDGTHSGSIGGLGSLEKSGAGALTLTGQNTYEGGTTVREGTLVGDTASLQGDISLPIPAVPPMGFVDPALVFDQGGDGTFAGVIDGEGALTKRGTGTVTLANDQLYTGGTTVAEGTLLVEGTTAGDAQVAAGATLGGPGGVAGLVDVAGLLAPGPRGSTAGDSIGSFSGGDVVFASGSGLQIHLAEDGRADLLAVTGNATLGNPALGQGTSLDLVPEPGSYTDAQGNPVPIDYVILTAGSGIDGGFAEDPDGGVSEDLAFLDFTVTIDPTSATLTAMRNGNTLETFAATPNQLAVATAMEDLATLGGEDIGDVFDSFFVMREADIPPALDATSGEQLTGFTTTRLAARTRFHRDLHERVAALALDEPALLAGAPRLDPRLRYALPAGTRGGSALRAAASGLQASGGPQGAPAGRPGALVGAWIDGYGLFGDLGGTSGTADLDYTIWGTSGGADLRPAEHWIAGLAAGYAASDLDYRGLSGSQTADTVQGGLYGGYVGPRFGVSAAFAVAWSDMKSRRTILYAPPASVDRQARADFDGLDFGASLEARGTVLEIGGFDLRPLLGFQYTRVEQDAFQESGAGDLSVAFDEQKLDSAVSSLGASLRGSFLLQEDTWLVPALEARWTHEFGDVHRRLSAHLGGDPAGSYQVAGAERPRDGAEFGLGWAVVSAGVGHVFVDYQLAVDSALIQHSVALGFELLW